jgi:RNA 3'-terminal phosphate cyclase (ATP)/RNA 3'-terminal phosphate cyclase (GTP)
MMENKEFLEIDGSFGEGGGSILRISAGFSILFKTPIKVKNIRANRSKSGLRLQHLLGLKTLANLTNSKLSESEVGSTKITLVPNKNKNFKRKKEVKVGTAASVGLLLQPIQIACMDLPQRDRINIFIDGGGTFGKWAPSINYLKNVTYKIFELSGYEISVDINKHGFYPKGGSQTECTITAPKKELNPLNLTSLGEIKKIKGEIICTNTLKKPQVAERIKESAEKSLSNKINLPIDIEYRYVYSLSTGVGLSLWAKSENNAIISTGTVLGERGVSSEEVGHKAAKKLLTYIERDIPVDNYLSDQLIPLMAYIDSPSKIRVMEVTSHAKTNLELIKKFNKREYKIKKDKNSYIIEYH